jgi:hypothetical protein
MTDEISDEQLCAIGTKVAMMGGMSVCSDDQLRTQTMDLLGIPDSMNPPCEEIFEEGFSESVCSDFPKPQVMAFCLVHNEPPMDDMDEPLLDANNGDLSEAVTQAWDIVSANCPDFSQE